MGLSIGDACAATGLSADTLRFYERIGLLGPTVTSVTTLTAREVARSLACTGIPTTP